MGYGIRVEVWGPYALFSRPEMKAGTRFLRCDHAIRCARIDRGSLLEASHSLEN